MRNVAMLLLLALLAVSLVLPSRADALAGRAVARGSSELVELVERVARRGARRAGRSVDDAAVATNQRLMLRAAGGDIRRFQRMMNAHGARGAEEVLTVATRLPLRQREDAFRFLLQHGHNAVVRESVSRYGANALKAYTRHGLDGTSIMVRNYGAPAARALSVASPAHARVLMTPTYRRGLDRMNDASRSAYLRFFELQPEAALRGMQHANTDVRRWFVGGAIVLMAAMHGDEAVAAARDLGIAVVDNAGELGTTAIEVTGDTISSPLNMLATAAVLIGALLALIHFAPTFIRRFRAIKKPEGTPAASAKAVPPVTAQEARD